MRVTLKDVAKKAGVSIGTASMALNNSEKVSYSTYKKVLKVARELNYVPDARARALVKQSTGIIALVVPNILNSFYAELFQGVKSGISQKDYNIVLCSTDGDPEIESSYIDYFKKGMVDGVIFSSHEELTEKNYKKLEELAKNYIPVVNINCQNYGGNLIPVIKTDLMDAAYCATSYLIELGHKKIGFCSHSSIRFKGYQKAMEEHGLPYDEFTYLSFKSVQDIVEDIIKAGDKPTAFLSYNDQTAIRLIQLLENEGIKVPQNISICGIDNIQLAQYYNPSLTTVDIPKVEMGKKAVEMLIELIEGSNIKEDTMEIVFPTKLVKRKSTIRMMK